MKRKVVFCLSFLLLAALAAILYMTFLVPKVIGITLPEDLHMEPGAVLSLDVACAFNRDNLSDAQKERAIAFADFTYESSAPNCISVGPEGTMQAFTPGNAVITVVSKRNVSACCRVEVSVPVTGVSLPSAITLSTMDAPCTLEWALLPANATDSSIAFSCSDESVVKVSAQGVLTVQGAGSATVRAAASNGVFAECLVQVEKATAHLILSHETARLAVGRTVLLEASGDEGAVRGLNVVWSSSDPAVASVDEAGLVLACGPGQTEISAVNEYGLTAVCKVTVYVPQIVKRPQSTASAPVPPAADPILPETSAPSPEEEPNLPAAPNPGPDIEYVNPNDVPVLPEENL